MVIQQLRAAADLTPPAAQGQYERVVEGLKAIQDIGTHLNEWALLILGATLAVMLSTSYRRPAWPYRAIYLLLLPAIGLMCLALQQGAVIWRVYGAMVVRPPGRDATVEALTGANVALANQMWAFQCGVMVLAVWLLCYVAWSIFIDKMEEKEG